MYAARMSDDASAGGRNGGDSGDRSAGGGPVTWRDLHLWEIQPVRDVLLGLAIFGLFWLGERISIVTVPLLLALLLAYLFEPVIVWLERRSSLKRRVIVGALIAAFVLVVVVPASVGVTLGVAQGASLLASTAERVGLLYESVQTPQNENLTDRLTEEGGTGWIWIRDRIVESTDGGEIEPVLERLRQSLRESATASIGRTASAGADVVRSVIGFLGGLFALGFAAFLTGFFFFFVSTGWMRVRAFAGALLPHNQKDRILGLAFQFDAAISGFIRGRLTIAFIQSVFFSVGYWLIGVPAAFILGPIVAVLSIVPYLAMVGIPAAVILLWLEPNTGFRGHWLWVIGAPTAYYWFVQALDDYVFTPLIQGKETGLATPAILFATIAGGALFGVFGMLIAIPLAACVKIVIAEILWPAFKEWAEGRSEDPLPIERST
jgi:predicted PurR-regulated permease PerM